MMFELKAATEAMTWEMRSRILSKETKDAQKGKKED